MRGDSTHTSPASGVFVMHPDRDDHGTVVHDRTAAWTPDELTIEPPDAGMVKVRWSDAADPTQLYWEYVSELTAVDNAEATRGHRRSDEVSNL
jgi:hypothetical protein